MQHLKFQLVLPFLLHNDSHFLDKIFVAGVVANHYILFSNSKLNRKFIKKFFAIALFVPIAFGILCISRKRKMLVIFKRTFESKSKFPSFVKFPHLLHLLSVAFWRVHCLASFIEYCFAIFIKNFLLSRRSPIFTLKEQSTFQLAS